MKIHSYEKGFLAAGIIVLVACAAALVYASVALGIHLPGDHGRVDPAQVANMAPFNQPGLRQLGSNRYQATIIGRAWSFTPAELTVPAGAEITFVATSVDVIHGLHVEGTRLNMMLIPGQISRITYTFAEPGEHLIICHEYCGLGHHTMAGKLIVQPASNFVQR